MEEKLILDESTPMEEAKEEINEELPKVQPRKKIKNDYKEKECKVISYNSRNNTLDVRFDKYGVRIKDVKTFDGDTVKVKYKGEIGKPNFECRL